MSAGGRPTDVIGMYLQEADRRKDQPNNTFDGLFIYLLIYEYLFIYDLIFDLDYE